jgi:hypothetical protein
VFAPPVSAFSLSVIGYFLSRFRGKGGAPRITPGAPQAATLPGNPAFRKQKKTARVLAAGARPFCLRHCGR